MEEDLCRAIAEKRRVRFRYHGRQRLVEPYAYGVSGQGKLLLHGYQVSGASRSAAAGLPGWRSFHVPEIHQLKVLRERFYYPPRDYVPQASGLAQVICEIG